MTNKIEFIDKITKHVEVYLCGNRLGTIRQIESGWAYFPHGQNICGEVFATLGACKQSLER